MAEKRKQHFVPQFLIKQFAEQNLVNVLMLNNGKIIKNVNYKSQCQIKYFYGKQGLEDVLSKLESEISAVILKLINGIQFEKDDFFWLLIFAALQITRTEKDVLMFSNNTSEMFNDIFKLANINKSYDPQDFISTERHINIALSCSHILIDLKYADIKNTSETPFILSDNPVIRYNQFYRHDDVINRLGLACKGLIIIVPLNLNTAILLYDSETYDVDEQDIAITLNDVRKINEIQTLNANEIVISNPTISDYELELYYKLRISNPPIQCPSFTIRTGEFKYLSYKSFEKINFKKELSFIKYKNTNNFNYDSKRKIDIRKYWENRL